MGNEHVERPWLKNYDKLYPPSLSMKRNALPSCFLKAAVSY